jgi:hypothetical protein
MNIQKYSARLFCAIFTIFSSPLFFQMTKKIVQSTNITNIPSTYHHIVAGTVSSIFLMIGYILFLNLFTNSSFIEEINNAKGLKTDVVSK